MENIDGTLNEYRNLLDHKEAIAADLSAVNKAIAAIENRIRDVAESSGLKAFATDRISITISDKLRARYAPEAWEGIVAWCVQNERLDLIHRRLSDTKVAALMGEGVALPDGLSLESYVDISYRRK